MPLCQGVEHSSQSLGMSWHHQRPSPSQHHLLPDLSFPTITSQNHHPEVSVDAGSLGPRCERKGDA